MTAFLALFERCILISFQVSAQCPQALKIAVPT